MQHERLAHWSACLLVGWYVCWLVWWSVSPFDCQLVHLSSRWSVTKAQPHTIITVSLKYLPNCKITVVQAIKGTHFLFAISDSLPNCFTKCLHCVGCCFVLFVTSLNRNSRFLISSCFSWSSSSCSFSYFSSPTSLTLSSSSSSSHTASS